MKCAVDFRRIAREALRGKWMIAVLVGLVATMLGGGGFGNSGGPEVKMDIEGSGVNASLAFAGKTIFSTSDGLGSEMGAFLIGSAIYIAIVAVIMVVAYLLLGSVISVGYARFNLDLVDGGTPSFETLFGYFSYWKTTLAARVLRSLYIFLWFLLLVIPGIVATYSYAMTEFILAEHPELTAGEAIARSKEMMSGNRWRLFCLHFSFIGWDILCAFTLGIGSLWLRPYKQAAEAAFYRDISNTGHAYFELP